MKNKSLPIILILATLITGCGSNADEYLVKRDNIIESVFASGSIESNRAYNLTAQTEGTISQINAQEGDSIGLNVLVALIDNSVNSTGAESARITWEIAANNLSAQSPAYREVQESLQFAEKKLAQDKIQLARMQSLLEEKAVTKLEVENAQLAVSSSETNCASLRERLNQIEQQASISAANQKANLEAQQNTAEHNQVIAPVAGRLIQLLKKPGDFVRKGDVIAKMIDSTPLLARLNVDETGIQRVSPGQSVNITYNTDRDHPTTGKVTTVYPQFDASTQSFTVDVALDFAPPLNVIGTRLEANIEIGKRENVLLVPRRLVDYSNRVRLKGEKELRTINVGFKSTEWVEVLGGLTENEIILPHAR